MLYALEQTGFVLVFILLVAYALWCVWQFIGWVADEIALLRARK